MSWDEIAAVIPFFGWAVAVGAVVGSLCKSVVKILDKV